MPIGGGRTRAKHKSLAHAHNFPRSLFETIHKRCNSNDRYSKFERVVGELRAKLGADSAMSAARAGCEASGVGVWLSCDSNGPGCGACGRRQGLAGLFTATRPHWCGGRRRVQGAWLRRLWTAAGPGLSRTDAPGNTQHATRHWCGGRRRVRRARAGFEARRRTQ